MCGFRKKGLRRVRDSPRNRQITVGRWKVSSVCRLAVRQGRLGRFHAGSFRGQPPAREPSTGFFDGSSINIQKDVSSAYFPVKYSVMKSHVNYAKRSAFPNPGAGTKGKRRCARCQGSRAVNRGCKHRRHSKDTPVRDAGNRGRPARINRPPTAPRAKDVINRRRRSPGENAGASEKSLKKIGISDEWRRLNSRELSRDMVRVINFGRLHRRRCVTGIRARSTTTGCPATCADRAVRGRTSRPEKNWNYKNSL